MDFEEKKTVYLNIFNWVFGFSDTRLIQIFSHFLLIAINKLFPAEVVNIFVDMIIYMLSEKFLSHKISKDLPVQ